MNRQDVACLALRLTAIYCFLQALVLVRELWYLATGCISGGEVPWLTVLGSAVAFALLVGAGLLLLKKSVRWARMIVPGDPQSPLGVQASAGDVQAIAFSIVGIYLFVEAVPEVLRSAAQLLYVRYSTAGPPTGLKAVVQNIWLSLDAAALQMLLGLALFVWGRGLVNLWHRVRTGGTQVAR